MDGAFRSVSVAAATEEIVVSDGERERARLMVIWILMTLNHGSTKLVYIFHALNRPVSNLKFKAR